ncbi:hypothetical protein BXZ70DRAFT_727875 [Cristinia sonorae]|uniref:Uncharacterized protein n=1 Tax=Cristinia sonorae TaxID=1940300 RepID=A0A8K0USN9_9AGAR|nr:hypothetical protein BXZ70DRAFT_727875 [Cristinia sonorae]
MSTPSHSQSSLNGDTKPATTEPEGGYPEQKHAGAVGLGPEYGKGASGGDKLTGWKEEIEGKILHNPAKAQHGKDMRTGELKKRQKEEDDKKPFAGTGDDDKDKEKDKGDAQTNSGKPDPRTQNANSQSGGAPPSIEANTGPNEKAAKEQAATTAPEGTAEADAQRKGESVDQDRQVDLRT